ncbi:hypothetical protein WMF27_34570 [Sorangium sp. So ce281]|uniref:hypothetical protein n=1 Tax=unclassified Sorangium TaxID=2621164 RepID=UPI003F648B10
MVLLPANLKVLPGRRIRAVARILFERDGQIESDDGPLELYLDDGTVVLFDGSADGESLRVQGAPWADPFEPPISDENRLYVEQSGKWSRFEQSSGPRFASLLGEVVSSVAIMKNQFGRDAGVQISIGEKCLWFVVAGDQCYVRWVPPDGFTQSATCGQ